jgi:hypothetical protein
LALFGLDNFFNEGFLWDDLIYGYTKIFHDKMSGTKKRPGLELALSDGIHFQGLRYIDITLAAYVGETVVIRYDPLDLAEIRVFYEDSYLCTAISPEISDYTVDLKDIISARNKRKRSSMLR